MANDKFVGADAFKKNFIESYVGNVGIEDPDDKRRVIDSRRLNAGSIADDIILITNSITKQNDLKNGDFAFEILNRKLQQEGYTKLVGENGKANIDGIKGILKQEIKEQVRIQKNNEKENNISNESVINEMSEAEVRDKVKKMDFSKLSMEDRIFLEENLDFSLKAMEEEEVKKFSDALFEKQDENIKEENNKILLLKKKVVEGKELTEEEKAFLTEVAESRGVQSETLLEDFEKALQTDGRYTRQIGMSVEHMVETEGAVTEEQLRNLLENISIDEEYQEMIQTFGCDSETFLYSRVTLVVRHLEEINGEKIEVAEILAEFSETEIGTENTVVSSQISDDEFFDDGNFEEVFDFNVSEVGELDIDPENNGISSEVIMATNYEEIDGDFTEKLLNQKMDESPDYFDLLQNTINQSEIQNDMGNIEIANLSMNQEPEEQLISEMETTAGATAETMNEEKSDPTVETQEEYDSKENEFEVKENPLKRFFSRIYNTIKRKDKLALDEPKTQRVEGNAKKVPIDPEKSQGYDLSDMGMVPANKIVRSNLVSLGRKFMSLFGHNNQNNENASKGNQYIHVEDTIDKYKVDLGSSGKIIPTNVGGKDKNRDESNRSNDDGLEL